MSWTLELPSAVFPLWTAVCVLWAENVVRGDFWQSLTGLSPGMTFYEYHIRPKDWSPTFTEAVGNFMVSVLKQLHMCTRWWAWPQLGLNPLNHKYYEKVLWGGWILLQCVCFLLMPLIIPYLQPILWNIHVSQSFFYLLCLLSLSLLVIVFVSQIVFTSCSYCTSTPKCLSW